MADLQETELEEPVELDDGENLDDQASLLVYTGDSAMDLSERSLLEDGERAVEAATGVTADMPDYSEAPVEKEAESEGSEWEGTAYGEQTVEDTEESHVEEPLEDETQMPGEDDVEDDKSGWEHEEVGESVVEDNVIAFPRVAENIDGAEEGTLEEENVEGPEVSEFADLGGEPEDEVVEDSQLEQVERVAEEPEESEATSAFEDDEWRAAQLQESEAGAEHENEAVEDSTLINEELVSDSVTDIWLAESEELSVEETDVEDLEQSKTAATVCEDLDGLSDEVEEQEQRSSELIEEDLDKEIVAVFVEEAEDIMNSLEEALEGWRREPACPDYADQLKRDLHTLKGGARMAGFSALGDLAHDAESLVVGTDSSECNDAFFSKVQSYQDRLVQGYNVAVRVANGADIREINRELHEQEIAGDSPEKEESQPLASSMLDLQEFESKAISVEVQVPKEAQSEQPVRNVEAPSTFQGEIKEVVRIGAEALDVLVNLSGENIIFRGRVEEQVSDFNLSLEEMEDTIQRLQGQVRNLMIETEAQVDYRREQIEASGSDAEFDPLEMDRYSHLQQLTRSLMESASDLQDLKETLVDRLAGTEALLLHQSRINTDLQEGLMKTRMVPFSRIVPRLRRIVRQVGLELGKDVQLRMENIQGEMDRSVLDRMLAPLEHMIRNAIDHGIESAEERQVVGKPATGTIAITTHRQGGDIVIRLADDGRGLDIERIRTQAVERQLISADANLSDRELAQFIFHPGFTTTQEVTQISGRGVGMDVVSSEVRQLGGNVEIETVRGQGAQFTVILPFTLSVNRALMIDVAGDNYALSLNAIDGVHYMTPEAIKEAVEQGGKVRYAGSDYELRYLGSMLNPEVEHRIDSTAKSIALVLFHSDNRYFAVQVDEVLGTQEVVVKSLGIQFAGVPGLNGATILSDGRVVVIIDLNELARVAIGELPSLEKVTLLDIHKEPAKEPGKGLDSALTILVVDDSVTVRKVTGRLLQRHGYRVLTAKDGEEALKIMQDDIPAAILLDIEMPKMDGFEVASRVRASKRLQDIPIIMITSRTGEKHRERALEFGVEDYLGKPYQEDQLLESLGLLLTEKS